MMVNNQLVVFWCSIVTVFWKFMSSWNYTLFWSWKYLEIMCYRIHFK